MDTLNDFLTYLTAEKGLSKNTTESYAFDLKKFDEFLISKKGPFLHSKDPISWILLTG